MNFWDKLFSEKKMVVGLSPMDGVTDVAMRYMTAKYSHPDVLLTEFVSVDALHYAKDHRRERLLGTFAKARDVGPLEHKPYEVAQVFGTKPDLFVEAAKLIESLGFDGIDINMGCPAHKVEENGSGAGLIRTPELAKEIILAVKSATTLPVSVKTRIGVDKIVVEEWMATLMEVEPANISLHGRTLKQLYQGSADWEAIGRAAEVVHKLGGHILGNGDITSLTDLQDKAQQYKVDGGLIGRYAEGNPAIFTGNYNPSIEQRKAWMLEHAKLFEQIFKYSGSPVFQSSGELQENRKTEILENDHRWFMPMRKHLAWYCKGFEGAVEMRSKLMLTNNSKEVEEIVIGIM